MIPRRSAVYLLAPFWLAVELVPRSAAACGACLCEKPRGVRPHADSITEVPLNARFFVELTDFEPNENPRSLDRDEIRWVNLDTNESIAFEVVDTKGTADQVWLVPTALLAPNTEFAIEVGSEEHAPTFREHFRTGTTVDESAPVASVPSVEFDNASSACDAFNGALLSWSKIEDNDGRITYDPLVELLVTQGSESLTLFLDATQFNGARGVQLAAPLDATTDDCWATSAIPFYSPGKPLTVTASLYDRAGNWTEVGPLDLTLRPYPGASCPNAEGDCSLTPPGARTPTGLGWVPLLGTLATASWRQRRKTKQRCATQPMS